jgi:sulfate/thiosulfate transport system ATP-binding protein
MLVRPFDLDIGKTRQDGSAVRAKVVRIHAAGPAVKVELQADENPQPILVEIPHDRFRDLAIRLHDQVFVRPKEAKVFLEDYSI